LAAIGGVSGIFVAMGGVHALVALGSSDLPRPGAIQVDRTVFVFALTVTALLGLAIGAVPAVHASRGDLRAGLELSSRRLTGVHQVTRRVLVVVEVALALMLLVSAGLLLRSLERLFAIAPGFDPSRVLTMQVQVASARKFPDTDSFQRFYADALKAAATVPGVASAAFTAELPLSDDAHFEVYAVKVEKDQNAGESHPAYRYAVSPGYFETMRIPLRRGRLFDEHDTIPDRVRPVVISESFARHVFPGQDPLGQRVRFGGPSDRPWDLIVGVVGDVRQASLAAVQTDAVYVSTAQWLWADNPRWLVVRARGDAATLAPAIRQAIWSVDKDQPIVRVETMDDLVAASAAERRFAATLFEAFAVTALVLAALGIYGVLSGSVTERMREIGVRSALGASRTDIVALVVRQGMILAAVGIAIGLGGAVAASRAIMTMLFGVSRLDPTTYAAVIALLAGVSAIACWLPAWRAAQVDPSITLRSE
jgi:putative ABC transport system permease protein